MAKGLWDTIVSLKLGGFYKTLQRMDSLPKELFNWAGKGYC